MHVSQETVERTQKEYREKLAGMLVGDVAVDLGPEEGQLTVRYEIKPPPVSRTQVTLDFRVQS